jgi:tetratricopeptide (TPR) repeat protein
MQKITSSRIKTLASILFLSLILGSSSVFAQTANDFAAERERAIRLANEGKFAEALPILEKLSADKQADGQVFLGLGLAHWQLQGNAKNKTEAKQIRAKARAAFLRAKELGASIPEVDLIIASIKPDGGDKNESDNPQAQAAYEEAHPAFAAQDYKKAAAAYEKSATLDPTWYEAALYTGNSYYALKEYDKAGIWFAKAIAIDPNRETAHRYWGDALMLAGKKKEAEDKFFDAIIADPYGSSAWRGLIQYAQRENIKLSHPKINIPVDFSASDGGNTKITLGIGDKTDDGSSAWMMYGISRALWQTDKTGKLGEKFAKAHPNEKVYRHSLAEEMDALHSVLAAVKASKEIKKLDPSLDLLKKLNDAGLLEAFVLFVRADAGVQKDYPAYRQNNRDKLKRYLSEFVMKNGGN